MLGGGNWDLTFAEGRSRTNHDFVQSLSLRIKHVKPQTQDYGTYGNLKNTAGIYSPAMMTMGYAR